MDVRNARTQRGLLEALITLMEEKGLEKISVQDLTVRAGCSRGTFYLHYKDKYDLLSQIEAELLQGFGARASQVSLQRLAEHQSWSEPDAAMLELCRYLTEQANAFRVLLGPKGDPAFPDRLKLLLRQQLYNRLASFQTQGGQTGVPHDFFVAYITSAHLGVLQHCLEDRMKYSPHRMALMLTRTVQFWAAFAQVRHSLDEGERQVPL